VHQVLDAGFISAPESLTIGFAIVMRNWWMPELVTVFYARLAVVFIVLACACDSIVKALRLHSLNLCRRSSPYFMAIIRAVAWRRRTLLWVLCLCCGNT
jgi:hypothetical protein